MNRTLDRKMACVFEYQPTFRASNPSSLAFWRAWRTRVDF
jgi:hypothetical protein